MEEKKPGRKSNPTTKKKGNAQNDKEAAYPGNEKDVAYQNKDITSKVLAEAFKGKTFRVYGLNLPEIIAVLPTNIPAVKVNELRLDNLFELADGSAAIVDYESEYKKEDKIKYLNYLTGIANRYLREKKYCPLLRMIVIYTGDIKRKQISAEYDIGAVRITLEPAFLSELDSDRIFRHLKQKVEKKEMLDDEELMNFIVLPLSYRKREEKDEKIQETVQLATQIQDRRQQLFTLAGILAFTDKVIDTNTANKIRRAIEMTKVAQIFEEEKLQALAELEEKSRQALEKAKEEKNQAIAKAKKKNKQALAEVKKKNKQALAEAKREKNQVITEAKKEKDQALAEVKKEKNQALAEVKKEKDQALAEAKKEKDQALAKVKREKNQALAEVKREKNQAIAEAKKEKVQALAEAKREKKRADNAEEKLHQAARESVLKMLKKNYPSEEIASIVPLFSLDDIENMRKELAGI